MDPIKKKYITRNILCSKKEDICDKKLEILNNVKPDYKLDNYEKNELEILLKLLNSVKNNLKYSEKKITFRYHHFDFEIDTKSIKFKFHPSPTSEYKERNLNKILKYLIYTKNHIKLKIRLETYILKNT